MFYILYFIFFPATLQASTLNHATLQLSPKLILLPFKGWFKKTQTKTKKRVAGCSTG